MTMIGSSATGMWLFNLRLDKYAIVMCFIGIVCDNVLNKHTLSTGFMKTGSYKPSAIETLCKIFWSESDYNTSRLCEMLMSCVSIFSFKPNMQRQKNIA
jgi:hypothetical protein